MWPIIISFCKKIEIVVYKLLYLNLHIHIYSSVYYYLLLFFISLFFLARTIVVQVHAYSEAAHEDHGETLQNSSTSHHPRVSDEHH